MIRDKCFDLNRHRQKTIGEVRGSEGFRDAQQKSLNRGAHRKILFCPCLGLTKSSLAAEMTRKTRAAKRPFPRHRKDIRKTRTSAVGPQFSLCEQD